MRARLLRAVSIGAVALSALLCAADRVEAQQLVIVVRHAERADDGGAKDSASGKPADPPLAVAGAARAERLAAMLAEAGVKAIYATEFKRTQETAKPLAARLGLAIQTIPARETEALAARLRSAHAQEVVVVIGHSNTVPAILEALGGPKVTMSDDEYDALYILSPPTKAQTLFRF